MEWGDTCLHWTVIWASFLILVCFLFRSAEVFKVPNLKLIYTIQQHHQLVEYHWLACEHGSQPGHELSDGLWPTMQSFMYYNLQTVIGNFGFFPYWGGICVQLLFVPIFVHFPFSLVLNTTLTIFLLSKVMYSPYLKHNKNFKHDNTC